MTMRTALRGMLGAGSAMTAVGTLTAVSATISGYPVFGGQAVRYAVAAVLLAAAAMITERGRRPRPPRPSRRDLLLLAALAGTGLAAFNVCIVAATEDTSPAAIGTVIATVPVVLAVGLVADGREVLRVPTAAELAGLGYLSVVVTTVAFVLWYDALGRLGADRAGLFAGVVPVSAVATTAVLGLGAPGPADLAGALLVGAGVVLGVRRPGAGNGVPAVPGEERAPVMAAGAGRNL